jgi:ADP-ribosylglycohydrolase
MAEYLIACVNTEHPHRHITKAGTGDSLALASQMWTVAEVRTALKDGDTFYTFSVSKGRRASVYADDCKIDGCDVKTIRSTADGIADDNLDNLRQCNE